MSSLNTPTPSLPRAQYTATGTQTVFQFSFPVFADGDLEVFINAEPLRSGYIIHGLGSADGGSVRFNEPPTTGTTVTLRRRVPVESGAATDEPSADRVAELAEPGGLIPVTPDLLERIRSNLAARAKEIGDNYPALVDACPYDMKLAVTAWVIGHIVDHATEGGSFRGLIYDRLGFETDAYVPLYTAGGMTITNEFVITEASPEDAALAQKLRDQLWPKEGQPITMEGGKEPWTTVCDASHRLEALSSALAAEKEKRDRVGAELGNALDRARRTLESIVPLGDATVAGFARAAVSDIDSVLSAGSTGSRSASGTGALPFSARLAADGLHRSLDLSASHATVLKQFADALQAAYDTGRQDSARNASSDAVKALSRFINPTGHTDACMELRAAGVPTCTKTCAAARSALTAAGVVLPNAYPEQIHLEWPNGEAGATTQFSGGEG